MTIDEAIIHAREKAREQKYYANFEKNTLKYQHCIECSEEYKQLAERLEELKGYKELDEQGLLLKLPCKVGNKVYAITRNSISEFIITSIEVYKEGFFINWRCEKGIYPSENYAKLRGFLTYALDKTVFLTREQAEQALARMKSEVE